MENNFNQPQKQSSIGVLVMFVDSLQKFARAFLPIILVAIFKYKEFSVVYFFLGLVLLLLITGVFSYLKFINFTFYIDDEKDEFIINDGVINKTKTAIQLHKIQQVNINQSLIQRIIGVYALDVDTAGSDTKEGNIKAISHELALALKAKLLENNDAKPVSLEEAKSEEVQLEQETHPFLKINLLSLLKIGITSNYVRSIGLILTFFFTIMEHLQEIDKFHVVEDALDNQFIYSNSLVYQILFFFVALFTVVFVINIARTLIRYFNYTITKQKGSLLLSFGLISTKSTIVKPEKVQIVTVSRNFLQKKLNVLELRIKQAVRNEHHHNKSQIEVPGCNEEERNEILKLIFKQIPQKGEELKPNFRKLVFSIFLIIILPLTCFYLFGTYLKSGVFNYSVIAILYTVFFLLILFFGFKNYRLFVNENHIIKQAGAWDIDHHIIEIGKIQAISTSQLFWHKSLNIGTLTLHTAAGNVTFQLGNYNKIKEYVNKWLYTIETSNINWM